MGISTILVSLNETGRVDTLLKVTANLAAKYDAHVIGLYVIPAAYVYPGVSIHVTADMIDVGQKFFCDRAKKTEEKFNECMRKQGLKGEWRNIEGKSHLISSTVVDHGRQADLVVISQVEQAAATGTDVEFAEKVIMDVGRPVLMVPKCGNFEGRMDSVVIGWNATRESARAAFDAIPIFEDGATAHIIWVDSELNQGTTNMLPGTELATTLARHNIEAISEPVTAPDLEPADVLLNRVSDVGADMLVMGAYGHSRLREFIFGGATRKILDQMTVPVLMSH